MKTTFMLALATMAYVASAEYESYWWQENDLKDNGRRKKKQKKSAEKAEIDSIEANDELKKTDRNVRVIPIKHFDKDA